MKQDRQSSFYAVSRKVRDRESRRQKAEKISYALTRYAHFSLDRAVCLDVGCSSGLITSAIAPLFGATFGIEYDELALQASDAETRARVGLVRGDAMRLPFANGTIDVIICAQVYEHVPDAECLMEEIHRILAPRGVVFFSGPNWLFPIEPHHALPFLHWLHTPAADTYLRLTGRGEHYYEKLRPIWALRRLVSRYLVYDFTIEALRQFHLPTARPLQALLTRVPAAIWRLLLPLLPSVNWILYKRRA